MLSTIPQAEGPRTLPPEPVVVRVLPTALPHLSSPLSRSLKDALSAAQAF